ncbi:uncharacterized protein LOC144424365 [Styela clava]
MSIEGPSNMEDSDAYTGFMDTFASDIGSTLEDLASDWNETDYEVSVKIDTQRLQTGSNRSSVRTRTSMDSLDGMADLSLRKARPLAFANPVYDLVNLGGVVIRSRQMTLIPLSQFDINKHQDDPGKHGKHKHSKRGSHGLINKLSHLTKRKHHSVKKHEQEMDVTAPLWTDHAAATVSFRENPARSASLNRNPSTENGEGELPKIEEKQTRPVSLEIEKIDEKATMKVPPPKVPRNSKGSFTPVSPIKELVPVINQPDNVFVTEGVQQSTESTENKENKKYLRSGVSSTSLASDVSEEAVEEDSKTMMEVMQEIEGDDSSKEEDKENITQQADETQENLEEDEPLLKRNKTLKWSGSRAAPALLREFTRKSKKSPSGRQTEAIYTDSPDTGESPARRLKDSATDIAQQHSSIAKSQADESKGSRIDKIQSNGSKSHSAPSTPKIRDASAFTILSSLLPPAPKLRRTESTKIRMYIHKMGTNSQNALGYATTQFVRQTLQSTEHRPVVLLHSIRSFLTDIRKYLISNPHVGFMTKIQKIVKHTHIMDVEGAIDDALERLVLYPLRDHIYKRLVMDYARTGKIRMVEDAIEVGKSKSSQELGIRASLIPPSEEALETVRQHFTELQATYSPYYKLKHLLSAVTTIYENTSDLSCEDQSARKIGADDFLPLLVYAILRCDFTAADIEAQYIDGLLDPTLLLGEGGYYLTTLISAVQVLSSMKKREAPLPNIADLQGFLKVGISSKTEKQIQAEKKANQQQSSGLSESVIMHKTLHVPPSMTAHNLGMMIAKKYGIKNTKDFCLHVVVNGVAYPLKPQEFPQLVKMDLLTQFQPTSFYFVYRQIDKVPEKPSERPVTMDTEHLKVNTEVGEHLEITSEKEPNVKDDGEPKEVSEDSESGKESSAGEASNDDLPPPPDIISSPGFADMPLPDSFFQQDSMHPPPDSTALSPDTTHPPPDATILPQDTMPLPQDATILPQDTMPPPQDATILPPDTMPPPQDATILPPDTMLPPQDATILPPDTMLPPQDGTILPPDTMPPPPDTSVSSPCASIQTNDATLQLTDAMQSPPTQGETLVSQEASFSQSDATLLEQHVALQQSDALIQHPGVTVDTESLKEPNKPSPSLKQTLNPNSINDLSRRKKYISDTSDTDTSSDEGHLDLSYQSATLVDDVLTPVKKKVARSKPPRQNKKARSPLAAEQEKENQNIEITHEQFADTQTLILEDSNSEIFEHGGEMPENLNAQSGEVPNVTLTDVSDGVEHEIETLSDVSNVSDGRHSVGCHSDGHYGDHEAGHLSNRGYHSDGHQVDESPSKSTDLGATATVSALKNFFEEEISKVSETATRSAPPHSPK